MAKTFSTAKVNFSEFHNFSNPPKFLAMRYYRMAMKSTEGMFLDHDITMGADLYATCMTGKGRCTYVYNVWNQPAWMLGFKILNSISTQLQCDCMNRLSDGVASWVDTCPRPCPPPTPSVTVLKLELPRLPVTLKAIKNDSDLETEETLLTWISKLG